MFRLGPLGAVAITEVDGLLVVENRVSIVGRVIQFGVGGFYPKANWPWVEEAVASATR